MEITVQKPSLINRPLGIFLIALGVAIPWILFPSGSAILALLAIVVIFIIGLKKPVWAMAAFLVAQITIPSYMVGPLSLRLLMLILIGLILWHAQTENKIQLGKNAKRVIIPVLILIGLSVVANVINSSLDFVFKDFRNMFGGLLIIIFLPALVRNVRHLKLLCGVLFIGLIVSTIIAIMQRYNILDMGQYLAIPGRVQGISENELELSYILCVGLLIILGILFLKGIKTGKQRLIISAILMLPALYFTYTRSALIALFFGLGALFLFFKTRIKGEFILILILAITFFLSVDGITDNFSFGARSQATQQASSISREILWQAGIAIAIDNPVFGIGGDQFRTIAPEYTDSVDPSLIQWEKNTYYSYRTLGSENVHNDFLYMWLSYGILALITVIWIIIAILRACLDSFRKSNHRFIKGLSVGLAAGIVAYTVNSFYHNLLTELPLLFILAGLSVATAKLAVNCEEQINESGHTLN